MTDSPLPPDLVNSPLARLFARARTALRHGALDEAVRLWRGAIAMDPDNVAAMERLATALRGLGRIAEAEAVLRTAIERAPDRASLHVSLGSVLMAWEAYEKAAMSYAKAARLDPADPASRVGLGRACLAGGDAVAAETAFRDALAARADHAPALLGLGDARRRQGDIEGARASYEKAVALTPEDATAQLRLAEAELRQGNYVQGWPRLEWRLKTWRGPRLDPGLPRWDGTALDGRVLLVRGEGGLAEILQFCRLLRRLPTASVVFEVPPDLVDLIRYGGWFRGELLPRGTPIPETVALWCPLLSLPGLLGLGVEGPIQPDIPYLRPDPAMRAIWRGRFGPGLKIGLHWHAGPSPFDDTPRALALADFGPLARLPGAVCVSLQKGTGREQVSDAPFPIQDWTAEMDETGQAFLDTITAIAALDAVVCADTAVAHLAGALGVPTWVAMRAPGPWVWGPEERDCPWYPSVRLVRVPPGTRYDGVFAAVAHEVAATLR